MSREVKITISRKFYPYLTNESRYLILVGGAGSGKSYFAAQKLLMRCLSDGVQHRFLIVRKVYATIQNSTFKLLKDLINRYELQSLIRVNETERAIFFNNGSEILSTGMDDPEKIKSVQGITGMWCEEATELNYEDLSQLDLRLRGYTDSYKQIIMTLNPIDEEHFIKTKFCDNAGDDVTIFRSTFKDNDFLDEEYKQILINRYSSDPYYKKIYIDGEWGKHRTGGEFYSAFNYSRSVIENYRLEERPIHISFDFNTLPYMTLTCWQIRKTDIGYDAICFDEFCLPPPKNKTDAICREFEHKYREILERKVGLYFYGDASGRNRTTVSNEHNYDIIERILAKYLSVHSNRVPKSNPPLMARRDFMNAIFSGTQPIRILIDSKCKTLIKDFENVKEDAEGGKLKTKVKDSVTGQTYEQFGHTSDSSDYLCVTAFNEFFESYR